MNALLQKYGRLSPIERVGKDKWSAALWRFACDCGNTDYVARIDQVRRGLIVSCGCLRAEQSAARGSARIKHGHGRKNNRSSEYVSWRNMLDRCYNPDNDSYDRYGDRGIAVCDRWRESFESFLVDMGLKPDRHHTIGRKNGDLDYEPDNCRWETKKEQARNMSSNRFVEYEGRTVTIAEACELSGVDRNVVDARLRRGWAPERAVTEPTKIYKPRR